MTKPPLPGVVLYDVIRSVGEFTDNVALFTERENAQRFIDDQTDTNLYEYQITERQLDVVPPPTT